MIQWLKDQLTLFKLDAKEQNALERDFRARKDLLLKAQKVRRERYRLTGVINIPFQ